jgi:hypothetical protein
MPWETKIPCFLNIIVNNVHTKFTQNVVSRCYWENSGWCEVLVGSLQTSATSHFGSIPQMPLRPAAAAVAPERACDEAELATEAHRLR